MHAPSEILTRPPVRLRRWCRSDQHAVHRAVRESLAELSPWLPWATDAYDLDAATAFLAQCDQNWISGAGYEYAITVDEEIVGGIGLHACIGPGGLEIGYWLHSAHTGRGLATTAVASLVDEAFTLPGIERIQIRHDQANKASGAIPHRLGFTEIAREPARKPARGGTGIERVWQLDQRSLGHVQHEIRT